MDAQINNAVPEPRRPESSSTADSAALARDATASLNQQLGQAYADVASSGIRDHAHLADPEFRIHPELRSAGVSSPGEPAMISPGIPQQQADLLEQHTQQQQQQQPMLVPVVGDETMGEGDFQPDGEDGSGGKGKRELSSSKRAAQNRAAQRAFRQRKETYIKKLERIVREHAEIQTAFKNAENEIFALKGYIAHLQGRLNEAQVDYAPPPSHINLTNITNPPHGQTSETPVPTLVSPPVSTLPTTLDAVAQAVQSLEAYKNNKPEPEAQELERQLQQPEGLQNAPM